MAFHFKNFCSTFFFRTIYHHNEQEAFQKKLESRVTLQDKEIEKMCNKHYQGFIDAVNELLQVQEQADSVKVCCLLNLLRGGVDVITLFTYIFLYFSERSRE